MDNALQAVLIQAGCYAGFGAIIVFGFSMMMRGFFWKYFKVKTSFGKYFLIKYRTKVRDEFAVGYVKDGVINTNAKVDGKKTILRYDIPKVGQVFYRTLNVNWVDIDKDTGAVLVVDYSTVPGHDPEKFDAILTRAIEKENVNDNRAVLMFVLVGLAILLAGAAAYLSFQNMNNTRFLIENTPKWIEASKVVINATARI